MDINVGFGKVVRVRVLKAHPTRRHIFAPKVETRSALLVRHEKAVELLERRREVRRAGEATPLLDAEIKRLGYAFHDEADDAGDCRFSYWRVR